MADYPLLELTDLTIDFPDVHGEIGLVQSVNLSLDDGECLGIVGESGSGKSLLGMTLLGLQHPAAKISGSVRFRGEELLGASPQRLRELRKTALSVVYQDALTSLNPTMRIGKQIAQAIGKDGRATPRELLEAVQIRDVDRCLRAFPFELSGGQRQRVLIALALAGRPSLIVADEPTTALDVTVQAQVVELLKELRTEFGFGLVFITHDLGLLGTIADRIACLYAGQLVETGSAERMLTAPRHHYMAGLLAASQSLESGKRPLHQIRGTVPSPANFGQGCRFAPRCNAVTPECLATVPRMGEPLATEAMACFNPLPESGNKDGDARG